MKMLPKEIDDKDFEYNNDSYHRVKHYLYYNKNEIDGSVVNINDFRNKLVGNYICFAHVPRELLEDFKKHGDTAFNRLLYDMKENEKISSCPLMYDEKLEWINLAKKYNMLPQYISEHMVADSKYSVDVQKLSPSVLYLYLNTLRVMFECTCLVRTVTKLVNKYEMDMASAWILASGFSINNSWHNIVGIGRSYGISNVMTKQSADFEILFNLIKYLESPEKYDDRGVYQGAHFNTCGTIYEICGINKYEIKLSANELLQDDIKKALHIKDIKKALSVIQKIRKISNTKHIKASA